MKTIMIYNKYNEESEDDTNRAFTPFKKEKN